MTKAIGYRLSAIGKSAVAPAPVRPTADSRQPIAPHGMTLVEILAVVVILGLLASILLVGFSGVFGKAKHELAKSGIGVIVSKLEVYKMEKNQFPDNAIGLAAMTDGQASPTATYYLSPDKLTDPWGYPYIYVLPGPGGHPYEIIAYGADGQPGGEGENADLSSTNLRADEQ